MNDGRLAYIFMDGLQGPIKLSLKSMEPPTLVVSICKAKPLEGFNHPRGMVIKYIVESVSGTSVGKELMRGRPPLKAPKPINKMEYATYEELRK